MDEASGVLLNSNGNEGSLKGDGLFKEMMAGMVGC